MQIELKYIECPSCKKWYSHSEITSYSHFGGAKQWSDGKFIGSGMSEYLLLPFARCEKCNNLFWFDDCWQIEDYNLYSYLQSKEIVGGKLNDSSENDNYKNNKTQLIVEFLKENSEDYKNKKLGLNYPPANWCQENITNYLIGDYIELLESSEDLNLDREIYLRTTLNQYINDLVRLFRNPLIQHIKDCNNIKCFFNFKQIVLFIKETKNYTKLYKTYTKTKFGNLQKLSELLQKPICDEYDDTEIKLIEIERELGHFDKAKSLIDSLDPIDKHSHNAFVKKSVKLIKKKSSKVFEIN